MVTSRNQLTSLIAGDGAQPVRPASEFEFTEMRGLRLLIDQSASRLTRFRLI
jgi:hypothetical protein